MLPEAGADGTPIFRATAAVDTIDFDDVHGEEGAHSKDEEEGHSGGQDPHFWRDPTRMAAVVTALAGHRRA